MPDNKQVRKSPTVVTALEELKEQDKALTPEDIVDRTTGEDFWNIYKVVRCSV